MSLERISIIKNMVTDAGEIALRHFGRINPDMKADRSLVTEADLEVGQFLTARLKLNFPDYGIINEEGEKRDSSILKKHEYIWVLDPIDGTAGYISRMPVWSVAVGLMRWGKPVMGMIYLPLTNEYYYVDEGTDSYFETSRWGKVKMDLSGESGAFDRHSLLLTVSYSHRRLVYDFPGKIRSMGSTSAHICYTGRGDAVIAVVKGAIWDLVPGWAILEKAGGVGRFLDGTTPDFGMLIDGKPTHDFLIVGSPAHVGMLENRISVKY